MLRRREGSLMGSQGVSLFLAKLGLRLSGLPCLVSGLLRLEVGLHLGDDRFIGGVGLDEGLVHKGLSRGQVRMPTKLFLEKKELIELLVVGWGWCRCVSHDQCFPWLPDLWVHDAAIGAL